MIAVDTNILVYAHRIDSGWHRQADASLTALAESGRAWAIPWPCLHEFLGIVTHPRVFDPPTPTPQALDETDNLLECPTLSLLAEDTDYWARLRDLAAAARIQGPRVHDARVAALCLLHGVSELWTADRDFSRFPALEVRNPLTAPEA